MRITQRCIAFLILSTSSLTLGGCAANDARLQRELTAILDDQASAWNRGDIDAFLRHYWRSDELTFSSGGRTETGWDATRERYRTRYPTPERMGRLTFEIDRVRSLGDRAALLLGRWQLERRAEATHSAAKRAGTERDALAAPGAQRSPTEVLGGNFSLVFQRFFDGWKIIHDHTSLLPREDPSAPASAADKDG